MGWVDGARIRILITNIFIGWEVDLGFVENSRERLPSVVSSLISQKEGKRKDTVRRLAERFPFRAMRRALFAIKFQGSGMEEPKGDSYRYHVTTNCIDKAKEQGLKAEHCVPCLQDILMQGSRLH